MESNNTAEDLVYKGLYLLKNLHLAAAEKHFEELLTKEGQPFTFERIWFHFHYAEVRIFVFI
jgi:hypothetical protein